MTQDELQSAAADHAAVQRKRFLAKLVVFAAIVAFAVLKPKVESWLNDHNPNGADVQSTRPTADRPAIPGDIDLGTRNITENKSDAVQPGDIVFTTTDPAAANSSDTEASNPGSDARISPSEVKASQRVPDRKSDSSVIDTAGAAEQTSAADKSTRTPAKTTSGKTKSSAKGSKSKSVADPSPPSPKKSVAANSESSTAPASRSQTSSQPKPKTTASQSDAPGNLKLVPGTRDEFRSPAGLLYARGSVDGHRLKHVLKHAEDNLDKPIHGVYSGDMNQILEWIDQAFIKGKKGGKGVRVESEGDRIVYTVDLGKKIGYVGGQVGQRKGNPACRYLRLVVGEDDDVVTAYPSQSL
ncbi:MAG: hypothetical protein R3C59_26790 [Planctomycetaceae bacterium]